MRNMLSLFLEVDSRHLDVVLLLLKCFATCPNATTQLPDDLTWMNENQSFPASSQLADGSALSDVDCDLKKKHDPNIYSKDVPVKHLVSVGPNSFDQKLSNLKETNKSSSSQDTPTSLYFVSIAFAFAVTVALILHIYLGEHLVADKSGVLVSDHERCTALGQRVLQDHGSSVDAAIAAVLCLGVVHPHVSGIGGGGVMMVHDIHKNETRVLNFQGSVPETLREEMLHNVSELKEGLQVGVPGMLRGLRHTHSLYGSLSWEDVVARTAAVAREGFNVSFSLSEALLRIKGEKLSQHFADMFFPGGRALRSGSHLRMPGLARVLEAGLSNFYDGNVSQEIVDVVRVNGGVLSREDMSNYSVAVEQPVEGLFNEFIIQVPPPPSTGAALISAIKGFYFSGNQTSDDQTYQRIIEATRAAVAMGSGLGDPKYNSSVTELLSAMLSKSHAGSPPWHSSSDQYPQSYLNAGQVVVMGPDDLIVSVASSLSRPFGSRLVTRSGVILNSLILDFSWPNKASGRMINERNRIQPGKRPLTSLMPTIAVPARNRCGLFVALGSSGGAQSFSAVTQVLIDALSHNNERTANFSLRTLHPQTNCCLGDEESAQTLHDKSHSDVWGILRNSDFKKILKIPLL